MFRKHLAPLAPLTIPSPSLTHPPTLKMGVTTSTLAIHPTASVYQSPVSFSNRLHVIFHSNYPSTAPGGCQFAMPTCHASYPGEGEPTTQIGRSTIVASSRLHLGPWLSIQKCLGSLEPLARDEECLALRQTPPTAVSHQQRIPYPGSPSSWPSGYATS